MAAPLLDSTKTFLNDEVVDTISNTFDETPDATRRALDRSLFIVLQGLINRVNEPGGVSSVMDMVAEVTAPNAVTGEHIALVGGVPAHLNEFLSDDLHRRSLLMMGNDLAGRLFGGNADALINAVPSDGNVKESSAAALLDIAVPLLLGTLGAHLAHTDTGVAGLAPLLNEQAALMTSSQ